MSPLCNTLVEPDRHNHAEVFYPLHAFVCEQCFLVQLEQYVGPEEIFGDYSYFSSYSDSWVEHARRYTDSMVERFGLDASSLVMEIASNDGYLLQHFVKRGIAVPGNRAGSQRRQGCDRARHTDHRPLLWSEHR